MVGDGDNSNASRIVKAHDFMISGVFFD